MIWNSIRTKLIVLMILAALVPSTATMLVSYVYTTNSLKDRAIAENSNLLYQGGENMKNYLEQLNRASLIVYSDAFFSRSLAFGFDNISARGQQTATLQSIAAAVGEIDQVYLYVDKQRQATLLTQNMTKRMVETDIYPQIVLSEGQNLYIEPPHSTRDYGFSGLPSGRSERPVLTMVRSILQIPSTDRTGVLAIDVRLDAISRIAGQLYQSEHERLSIIDGNDRTIYSDDAEQIGRTMTDPRANNHGLAGADGHFEVSSQIYIYRKVDTPAGEWTIVKQIPSSYLTRDTSQAAAINVLLIAVSLICIIAAIIFITVRITEPIKKLVRYMNQIKSGHLTVDINTDRKDEIGLVYKRFSSMMDTINNLILREYKWKLANSTNHLRALQAQVNPHFMNNALQTIGTLALEHGMKQIYSLISALARMMRYSMHNTDKPVPLRTELEHVKDYLQLQYERFENRFVVRYDLEESTLDAQIPKMIVQPLVENFFKHGMRSTGDRSTIALSSRWLTPSVLEVSVEDDGAGMPRKLFERLLLQLQMEAVGASPDDTRPTGGDAAGEGGIGLANVRTRLKLFFGDEAAGFRVENLFPHGFRVVLTMNVEGERN